MRILVLVFVLFSASVYAQKDYGYYVKTNGDTVKLGKKNYIMIDSHPQLLKVKNAAGKWKVVFPDSVVFMRKLNYNYGKTRFVNYTLLDIPMANGKSCRHYLNKMYTGQQAEIHETPYCSQCNAQHYYIIGDGKYLATMKRNNFQELVTKYFSNDATLMNFASKKRYWSKLNTYLYKLQTPALDQ